MDVDHVRPLSLGGEDTDSNSQVLCHGCHGLKTEPSSGLLRGRVLPVQPPREPGASYRHDKGEQPNRDTLNGQPEPSDSQVYRGGFLDSRHGRAPVQVLSADFRHTPLSRTRHRA
ncbi:HNH endonuclease [Streptomyces yangpuensis]|uniref:HNH endonuclease n=1 Tax=Streptomyces yangpuensis TaxID=1648182 RepID=UPI0036A64D93